MSWDDDDGEVDRIGDRGEGGKWLEALDKSSFFVVDWVELAWKVGFDQVGEDLGADFGGVFGGSDDSDGCRAQQGRKAHTL